MGGHAATQPARASRGTSYARRAGWVTVSPDVIVADLCFNPPFHSLPASLVADDWSFCDVAMSPALAVALDDHCRRSSATLESTLAAGVALLQHRYTAAAKITVICRRGTHGGTAMSTCTVDPTQVASLGDLVRQVEWRGVERHDAEPGHAVGVSVSAAGETFRPDMWNGCALVLDAHLDVGAETPIRLEWRFRPELLDTATVAVMSGQLTTVLRALVAGEKAAHRELRLGEESSAWRNASGGDPPAWNDIARRVLELAALNPDTIAIAQGDEVLSYGDLATRATQVAGQLRRSRVGRGDLVAVLTERGAPAIVTLLGVLTCGAAYVPVDPRDPEDRLRSVLRDARVAAVLASADCRDLALRVSDVPVHVPDFTPSQPHGDASDFDFADHGGDAVAYVCYTSGSTGQPKGVVVPHRAVARLVSGQDYAQPKPGETVIHASSLTFDAATFEIWGALANGATLRVMDTTTLVSAQALAAWLDAYPGDHLFLTTAVLHHLASAEPALFRSLGTLLFGGERCDPAIVAGILRSGGPPARLVHVYGPTENTTFSTWFEVRDTAHGAAHVPIGAPINGDTCILREVVTGGPAAPLAAAELWLSGPGLAHGYLNAPVLTAEKFVPLPGASSGVRAYRTGDVVRCTADGAIVFLGRLDRQVKIRGFRIELSEVEVAARRVDGVAVAKAEVVDRPDLAERRLLALFVVPDAACDPQAVASLPDRVLDQLRTCLPAYMVPKRVLATPSLPLASSGKVDRAALIRLVSEPASMPSVDDDHPEAFVRAVWCAVLGHEDIEEDANFFAIGGHSLDMTRVASRVNKRIGKRLPLSSYFDAPTISGMAAMIEPEMRPTLKAP